MKEQICNLQSAIRLVAALHPEQFFQSHAIAASSRRIEGVGPIYQRADFPSRDGFRENRMHQSCAA
jgi:hypothetical protein